MRRLRPRMAVWIAAGEKNRGRQNGSQKNKWLHSAMGELEHSSENGNAKFSAVDIFFG
jgi:hypothetical protein